jgi:hypothetical protein
MRIFRCLSLMLLLSGVSCHSATSPSTAPPPRDSGSESKKGTISVTIDGREATPEEEAAFGAFAEDLLSKAVHKAVNNEAQEILRKRLEITDSIETDLLSVLVTAKNLSKDELRSVHLIRPAKEIKEPRTIVLSFSGKHLIRFTRATAPVEHPVAIITQTFAKH